MRMVVNISKAELRNLFYSPVAWFLLIAFLVQCAWFFTGVLSESATWQDILLRNDPAFTQYPENHVGFTRVLFLGGGMYPNILQNLYLFIPLLTMGLIGREVQHGTAKLLYSSPVKLSQIVLGKFLAIMIYNLIMVLIVGIFMVTAALSMKSIDYGMLFSASLGFYLLACAYTAIGMFMSSITTYQIVAAISTFLVFFALANVGGLWQQYDFIRDLTFFLHLRGRTEKMLVGLLTTKDVIYFLVVIALFLSFTWLRLQGAREAKPWYIKTGRYLAVIITGLLIGYITSRPVLTGYWDTTALDRNTIHPKTQALIQEMGDEPLEVTLYVNFLGTGAGKGMPAARNAYLQGVWEKYVRFKPGIKFRYVYYYDYDSVVQGNHLSSRFRGKSVHEIAAKIAGYGETDTVGWMKPALIRQQIDLRPEGLRLVMQLKYKGRTEFLRTYNDNRFWPDEPHFAAAFKRLLNPAVPKVAFITGHYERHIYKKGEREFSQLTAGKDSRMAMINLGFDVDTISLDREEFPANISTLVLADPKSALSERCREKIRQYLEKGGNMMILGEPGKQPMTNPVLQQLGVQFREGAVIQDSRNEVQTMITGLFTNAGLSLLADQANPFKKVKDGHEHMPFPGTCAITWNDSAGFTIHSLLEAEEEIAWLKQGIVVADSAYIKYDPQGGDTKGSLPLAIGITRNINEKQQRIFVAGDADFLSNLRSASSKANIEFFSWLENGAYPIITKRPPALDRRLTISAKSAELLKVIYVWVLPGILLLGGTILLIRRKRK